MVSVPETIELSDSDYARFRDFLGEHCGLHYPEARKADLAHGLSKALKSSPYRSYDEYYRALEAMHARGPEMDRLVSTLTVGESYFFRITKHFDCLRKKIFPKLITERARSSRRIRIWSAGSSTGEEAYSLAIALRQCLPNIDTWNISILATDIDQEALRRARLGVYGDWSFREMEPTLRDLYFKRDGRRYFLSEDIKRMVDFQYLNLVEDSYPSLTTNTNAMDVIFCRNVTIYFSHETTTRVIRKLHSSLIDRGWLFVGASEPNMVNYRDFEAITYEGQVSYQKDLEKIEARMPRPTVGFFDTKPLGVPLPPPLQPSGPWGGVPAPAPPAAPVFPPAPEPPFVVPTAPFEPAASVAEPEPAGEQPGSDAPMDLYDEALMKLQDGDADGAIDTLFRQIEAVPDHAASFALLAKTYANLGQLEQAQHWCERAIKADKLLAEAHYTLALIYEEQGLRDKATESLRKTLFLDRDHVLAHYVLGTLYRQSGIEEMARKAWENAARILDKRSPTDVVPDSDGVTTRRLLDVIQAQLAEATRR